MKKEYVELLKKTNVVGVVTQYEDLFAAQSAPLGSVDALEMRLDKWPFPFGHPHTRNLIALGMPLIITPRDERECGMKKDWTVRDRTDLFFKYMPHATFIDVEASTAESLGHIIKHAHQMGVWVIISYHNFTEMPSYAEIICQAEACRRFGGDVLKIAVNAQDYGDLSELYDAVNTITVTMKDKFPFKVSVMAMGRLGGVSRFVDALMGGPLVYGCFSKATVTGQPKAIEVKKLLAELR